MTGIGRFNSVPNIAVLARCLLGCTVTLHEDRIERVLKNELARYSARVLCHNTSVVSIKLDSVSEAGCPVEAMIKTTSQDTSAFYNKVRAKHIISCDGALLGVRTAFGLELKSDTRVPFWGVLNLMVDADFPDIRRRCAIHSDFSY